jgi:hypothetical protein
MLTLIIIVLSNNYIESRREDYSLLQSRIKKLVWSLDLAGFLR